MIYQFGQIVLAPGKMAEWAEIYSKEMVPLNQKMGMKEVGSFRNYTGNMNQVYHLWVFDDLAAVQKSRLERQKDKEFQKIGARLAALRVSQIVNFLEPNPWSPMK